MSAVVSDLEATATFTRAILARSLYREHMRVHASLILLLGADIIIHMTVGADRI